MKMKWLIRIVIYLIAFLIIRHLCLMIYYYAPERQVSSHWRIMSPDFAMKMIVSVMDRSIAVKKAFNWSIGLGFLSVFFGYRNYSWFNILEWFVPNDNFLGLDIQDILNLKIENLQKANRATFLFCIFFSIISFLVIMLVRKSSNLLTLFLGCTLPKVAVFAILPVWFGLLIYASLKDK